VFTTTGRAPLNGWSKYKARLDRRMLALLRQWAAERGDDPEAVELEPWQHRDLRRTARTLMSRMGVDSKIAEHALAHVPPGVEGIYDRHHYLGRSARRSPNWPNWSSGSLIHRPTATCCRCGADPPPNRGVWMDRVIRGPRSRMPRKR
jgi:hypothetical protein